MLTVQGEYSVRHPQKVQREVKNEVENHVDHSDTERTRSTNTVSATTVGDARTGGTPSVSCASTVSSSEFETQRNCTHWSAGRTDTAAGSDLQCWPVCRLAI